MYKFLALAAILLALLLAPLTFAATSPFDRFFFFPFPRPSTSPNPSPSTSPQASPAPVPSPQTNLKLTQLAPTTVNFSQSFILKGTGFGTEQGQVIFFQRRSPLKLAGAPIVSWTDTEIRATVPSLTGSTYYDVAVEKKDFTLSNKLRIRIRYGQPNISSIAIIRSNTQTRIILGGDEFGSRDGKVNFYSSGNTLVGNGQIKDWSDDEIEFIAPSLPPGEYAYQIETEDGRLSSIRFLNL